MKSVKRFFHAAGLLTVAVAVLSISMAAQQEVNPDHFDDQPAVAKASKSAPAQKQSVVVAAKETPVVTASNQRYPILVRTTALGAVDEDNFWTVVAVGTLTALGVHAGISQPVSCLCRHAMRDAGPSAGRRRG